MKKLLAALAAVTLLAAGCTSTTSPPSPSTSSEATPVTITYGLWDDNFKPGYEKALAKFKETHPNIDVKFVVTPFNDYDTKLQASVSSKTAPDVFWLQDSFSLYAKNGALADLSDKIKSSQLDLSTYAPSALAAYQVDGKQYGMPWTTITVGLWYNKALFDKAGVTYPDKNWTWDDLRSAATKLTNNSSGVYGLAAPVTGQEGYYNTIYQAGGDVINADGKTSGLASAASVQGLSFWADFARDGLSPSPSQLSDTPASQLFSSGKLAMFYGGSWNAKTLSKSSVGKTIDVAPLPAGPTKTVAFTSAVNAISASSKNPDAAWEWTKFLASPEAQDIQAADGVVAPASSAARDAWVGSLPAYDLAVFMDQTADAKALPVSLNTFAWRNQETSVLSPAFTGKESVQDAAQRMAAVIDKALADEAGQ